MTTPLLQLKNVTKIFGKKSEQTIALEDMTLALDEDFPKIITVAGEMGAAKPQWGCCFWAFMDRRWGGAVSGRPLYDLKGSDLFQFRREVQAVFQDPFAVYNPFYVVDNP